MPPERRVIILCTGNSCRSQLAEALWRARWGDEWEVRSAGTAPTGAVHPLVPRVLAEIGVDAAGLASEPLPRYASESFDLAVTVCDSARESCPVLPGARRTLHWPFPDPASFAEEVREEEALEVFRTARDAIEARILRYRERLRGAEELGRWLGQLHDQLPSPPPAERSRAFLALVAAVEELIAGEKELWRELPGAIRALYAPFGWEWNGIYALRGTEPRRRLELAAAAGPPVCATIEERPGGLGASGMCFDALLAGHALVAGDVRRWPGYVSCDGESGLRTVAGLAVPLAAPPGAARRGAAAVWDLDSTAPLDPSDPLLLGALLARAAAVFPLPKAW